MRFATAFALFSAFAVVSAEVIDGLVKRGQTSEVCACFSGALTVTPSRSKSVSVGIIEEICICESEVPTFVDTHPTCQKGSKLVGKITIIEIITIMIQKSPHKSKCTFPKWHTPSCSRSNLCDFNCHDGFTKEKQNGQWQCVCKAPKSVCNNKCSHSCPSARSLPEKRDLAYWGKQTQRTCKPGWQACGIFGGGPRDWECVDVKNDLESCGGCPMDVATSLSGKGLGVDCTTLPGVSDVSCASGVCAVHKCLPGYKVSRSGQHCEEDRSDDPRHGGVLSDAFRVVSGLGISLPK